MNGARPFVAYCFAYVGRQLRSQDEVNANATLMRQLAAQLAFGRASGRRILEKVPDWSTYRLVYFVSREKFRHAVEVARSSGADLLLANIRELMARTPYDRISECANVLNSLDIEVWDASLGRTWHSMSGDERKFLILGAAQERQSRSKAVKVRLQLSGAQKTAVPNSNYKHGNRANRLNAYERAHRLRNLVLAEIAKLPMGEELSPSALAKALNEAGVASARGGRWSHNTAKDLMARIRALPANLTST